MGLLKTKERTAQQEAERQSKILTEIEHQRQQRAEAERELTRENARRRQVLFEQQEQEREDKRMASAAAAQQERRDREQRQRESEAKLNQQRVETYRAAKLEVENIDRAIGELSDPTPDLSSPAAAIRAAERQAQVTALRQIREKADARLLAAERGIGRHRGGGW